MSAPGPGGGFGWDGRADSLAAQAAIPLLSPFEMGNRDAHDVATEVRVGNYREDFGKAFADHAATFETDDAQVLGDVGRALEAFQREDASFHPYTSKFDLHTGNKKGGQYTAAEQRGAETFTDPATGNCASCHFPGAGLNGSTGMFSDFSFEAIGVPRNGALAANADAGYFDVGICGPLRKDHRGPTSSKLCGMFKTPTLRNLAKRAAFFHNGVMHSLEQVLRFYATRDSSPELWYPTVGGTAKAEPDASFPRYGLVTTQYVGGRVQKYDDLPARYRTNVDAQRPLDGRKAGAAPALSEKNVQDLLCFLGTLNDGYAPPATPPTAGPCVD